MMIPSKKFLILIILSAHSSMASGWAQDLSNEGSAPLTIRDRESQKIFRQIIIDSNEPETCEYDTGWWREARLPADIAKVEFGTTVDADLSPPFPVGHFRSIVDSEKSMKIDTFCSSHKSDDISRINLNDKKETGFAFVVNKRILFGYPIFNAKRNKAAVMITHRAYSLSLIKENVIKGPVQMSEGAIILRKIKGKWRRVGYHSINIS